MDDNKRISLEQIGYKINETCGLCAYSHFPNNDWGTCSKHSYEHKKHTESNRNLSIHRSGNCSGFVLGFNNLDGFLDLLEKK